MHGRITTRHQGGGHKRAYRLIDFRRADKDGVPARVAHIEYDPNRTARIALLHYADGEKRYILAPQGLRQGDRVENGPARTSRPGNCLPLRNIPTGTVVHAIELRPGGGAKIAPVGRVRRAAARQGGPARRSCACRPVEIRRVDVSCRATVGEVGNAEQGNIKLRQGRPQPVEGPPPAGPRRGHEPGRPPARRRRGQELGGRHPVTPWGKPEGRTRKASKPSDAMITRRRKARRSGRSTCRCLVA